MTDETKTCVFCDATTVNDPEIDRCDRCGQYSCEAHSLFCEECQRQLCEECGDMRMDKCVCCRDWCCDRCATICPTCGSWYCAYYAQDHACLEPCDECSAIVCEVCAESHYDEHRHPDRYDPRY